MAQRRALMQWWGSGVARIEHGRGAQVYTLHGNAAA